MGGGIWHAWEERELRGWFCSENLKGKGLVVRHRRRRKENIFFFLALRPNAGQGLLTLEISKSHTQRRTTVGRTPLDE